MIDASNEPDDGDQTPDEDAQPKRDANGHFLPGVLQNPDSVWKPGQSGNPKGRPPGVKYISELLRAKLHEPANPKKPDGKTNGEVIVENWIDRAKQGIDSPAVAAAIADRTEGKPRQTVEVGIQRGETRADLKGLTEQELEIYERLIERSQITLEPQGD